MSWLDRFQTARRLRLANLALQTLLVLTLFAGLNALSLRYAWRFDLSQHRLYSLSGETRAYLRTLAAPVEVIVTLSEETDDALAQAYRDVTGLLREYAYATEGRPEGKISVRTLDVFRDRREAERQGVTEANIVLFKSGPRQRVVPVADLYRIEQREKTAFQGEAVFTAALLDVSNPAQRKKVYFVYGHGELRHDDVDRARGLSELHDALRQRNYELGSLDLTTARELPEDAAALLVVGPRNGFLPTEQELLRHYLSARAGRLLLFLDPGVRHGLSDLLLDWGVLVDDNVLLDTSPGAMTQDGDFVWRAYAPHPLTRTLVDNQIPLVTGPARTVRIDPSRRGEQGLNLTGLVAASPSAWGERNLAGGSATFDPGVDLRARTERDPLTLAAASERLPADHLPFSVRGGKLVVFGTSELVTNARLAALGNLTFFLNAVAWAVDRDNQLAIPPRPLPRYQLTLAGDDLTQLRLALLFGLPGAVSLLGLLVAWKRRS